MPRGVLRSFATLSAALPIAFGSIRALQTGSDFRYLWVALASLAATALVITFDRARRLHLAAASAVVFVASASCGMLAAMLLGTTFNPGMLVVVSAFGVCCATASALYTLSRS